MKINVLITDDDGNVTTHEMEWKSLVKKEPEDLQTATDRTLEHLSLYIDKEIACALKLSGEAYWDGYIHSLSYLKAKFFK